MTEYGKIHTDGSRSGGQPVGDPLTCRACAQNRGTILQLKRELADFKQEVSDALVDSWYHNASGKLLERFIIHKPKPDPLVAVVYEVDNGPAWDSPEDYCNKIRVALEARGLEIREKGQ